MNMNKLKSEGKCVFCEKTYAKRSITRHLNSHLETQGKASSEGNKYFHIRVEAAEMFLQLLVSHKAELYDLDFFLRRIWLECCDHLSSFGYRDSSGYGRFVEIGMDTEIGKAFKVKKRLSI